MKGFTILYKLITPQIISLFIIIYGILSYLFCIDPFIKDLNPKISCSPFSLFLWILFALSLYLGSIASQSIDKFVKNIFAISLLGIFIALFSVFKNLILVLFIFIFLISTSYYILFYEKIYTRSLWIGFALMSISLLFTGVPLLKGTHSQFIFNLNPVFIVGYSIALLSLIFLWPRYNYIWILFILFSVISTYRVLIVIPIFILFLLFFEKKEKNKERKNFSIKKKIFLIFAIILFLFLILVSEYFIRSNLHDTWKLDILRSAEYRAAFTFSTFDKIISASLPFGYSFMITLFSPNTGKLICEIAYSCNSTINAGIFAPFFIDMGILSLIIFFLIGKILRDLYERNFRIYSVAFSLLISSIDIGISIYSLSLLTILWVKVFNDEKNS